MQKHILEPPRNITYRLVIAGCIGDGWGDWFGADRVDAGSETTDITVSVADQAELFGRLHRVQDLNLQILALTLLSAGAESPRRDEGPKELGR